MRLEKVNMTEREKAHIDWAYDGKVDALMGTGATQIERTLVWLTGAGAAALYGFFYAKDVVA
jgi:hypothetical protein